MVDIRIIEDTLNNLGFEKNGNVFSKRYLVAETPLVIDICDNHIGYKDIGITVTRATTSNFDEPENLIVLECVDRLLEKKYLPEHIELEPHWKLGRGTSGGFGDIWIRKIEQTPTGNYISSLVIIECKTFGQEFNDEWKKTLNHGGQLFTYFQQEQSTKFLCLYTSSFYNGNAIPLYYLINVQDNTELLLSNKLLQSFSSAHNSSELFSVWKITYNAEYATVGLFEDEVAPYEIGKNKFSTQDLREVDDNEIRKLYNEFALILRQHNVSGKENAFDKLVNLFLAKVVDETNNPSDLHFYWKGSVYDDDFRLQDRLQRLYRDGMKKFLGEDVTYIENKQIEDAFRRFANDPDATRSTILDYFRALKFFSDNDFSFISVHNEKLFYQNATVLKKVVRMLQDIKLKSTNDNQNQFLGDLFEGFLTKGVKQSEGQFFTPMPIVRFLISSLPLENIIQTHSGIPTAIDYACGAGHFLTEYAVRIKEFVQKHRPEISIKDFYSNIIGIEKEYRLSKVSKVAAFMYGQDDIKIVYADALSQTDEIKDNYFDVLVANPPYAVSGFLETLSVADRQQYQLFNSVASIDKSNAIETFFIERASQLLRSEGVAALVLPSTILSKSGVFSHAREILLKDFDLISIVEFGNKTFGKTSTSTVVLFLRRKERTTPDSTHFLNRVNSWFSGVDNGDDVYNDSNLWIEYCKHQSYPVDEYIKLFNGKLSEKLLAHPIFQSYNDSFFATNRNVMKDVCEYAKTIRAKFISKTKTVSFKRLDINRKKEEANKAFKDFVIAIEKDKLYYFILSFSVQTPVVVVKSPASNSDLQKFLGYKWSDSKGQEGINYLHVSDKTSTESAEDEDTEDNTMSQIRGINGIVTPLFNPSDLTDEEKINTIIHANFLNKTIEIPESLEKFVTTISLVDMLDFSLTSFNKEIRTSVPVTKIPSRFSHTPLKKIFTTIGGLWRGKKPPFVDVRVLKSTNFDNFGNLILNPSVELPVEVRQFEKRTLTKGDIILEKSGGSQTQAVGRVAFFNSDDSIYSFSNFTVRLRLLPAVKSKFLSKYVFHLLNDFYHQGNTFAMQTGMGNIKNLNMTYFMSIQIPDAPFNVQEHIISLCDEIDSKIESASREIEDLYKSIDDIINSIEGEEIAISSCVNFVSERKPFSEIEIPTYVSTDNMLPGCHGITPCIAAPNIISVVAFRQNDILLSNIRPYLQKLWLAEFDGGCSPDVLVMRVLEPNKYDVNFIYYSLRRTPFFEYIMSDIKGMKMPRGKKETIQSYRIKVPSDIEVQRVVASEIKSKYVKISALEIFISEGFVKKQNIILESIS